MEQKKQKTMKHVTLCLFGEIALFRCENASVLEEPTPDRARGILALGRLRVVGLPATASLLTRLIFELGCKFDVVVGDKKYLGCYINSLSSRCDGTCGCGIVFSTVKNVC